MGLQKQSVTVHARSVEEELEIQTDGKAAEGELPDVRLLQHSIDKLTDKVLL